MTEVHLNSSTSTVTAAAASTAYFLDDGKSIQVNSLLSALLGTGTATGRSYTISGDVYSMGGAGMVIGEMSTHSGTADLLEITASGSIIGSNGLVLYGDGQHVTNAGAITGSESSGLYINAGGARIDNSGAIGGEVNGIVSLGEHNVIRNGGTIQSEHTGVHFLADTGTLINRGLIQAQTAVDGTAMKDGIKIVNHGTISGNIEMGGGDDIFDNRGGVAGWTAYGRMGDDSYYVDSAETVHIEEATAEGTDSVYAKASWTLGDNFENLFLIGKGAINGKGNALDNRMIGNDRSNHLVGAGGSDEFASNGGNDIMKGGAGADRFLFETGDGKDRILDFGRGHDRIELDELDGVDGFHDLMKHHVRVEGHDVVIDAGKDELTLVHVDLSALHASDFVF